LLPDDGARCTEVWVARDEQKLRSLGDEILRDAPRKRWIALHIPDNNLERPAKHASLRVHGVCRLLKRLHRRHVKGSLWARLCDRSPHHDR
jgi:hypothetical protein